MAKPHNDSPPEQVNDASIVATIICALREFQEKNRHSDYCGDHFGEDARPLEPAEIDEVIENLNFGRLALTPQGEIMRCPFNDCTEVPVSTDAGFEMPGFCCSNERHYFQVNEAQLEPEDENEEDECECGREVRACTYRDSGQHGDLEDTTCDDETHTLDDEGQCDSPTCRSKGFA